MSGIAAGDMVMVVRDCCGRYLGQVFRVQEVHPESAWICGGCNGRGVNPTAIHPNCPQPELGPVYPLPWLRKLPPLDEPEHEVRKEEIEA